jgi:hypothetical protein
LLAREATDPDGYDRWFFAKVRASVPHADAVQDIQTAINAKPC